MTHPQQLGFILYSNILENIKLDDLPPASWIYILFSNILENITLDDLPLASWIYSIQ